MSTTVLPILCCSIALVMYLTITYLIGIVYQRTQVSLPIGTSFDAFR